MGKTLFSPPLSQNPLFEFPVMKEQGNDPGGQNPDDEDHTTHQTFKLGIEGGIVGTMDVCGSPQAIEGQCRKQNDVDKLTGPNEFGQEIMKKANYQEQQVNYEYEGRNIDDVRQRIIRLAAVDRIKKKANDRRYDSHKEARHYGFKQRGHVVLFFHKMYILSVK
jgi:hypothetical protein